MVDFATDGSAEHHDRQELACYELEPDDQDNHFLAGAGHT